MSLASLACIVSMHYTVSIAAAVIKPVLPHVVNVVTWTNLDEDAAAMGRTLGP